MDERRDRSAAAAGRRSRCAARCAAHQSGMTNGTKRTGSSSSRTTPGDAARATHEPLARRRRRRARRAGRPARAEPRARGGRLARRRRGDADRVERRLARAARASRRRRSASRSSTPAAPSAAAAPRESSAWRSMRPDVAGQLRQHARRGSPSRCRPRARDRAPRSSSSSHMRATTSGWEIVWPHADRQRAVGVGAAPIAARDEQLARDAADRVEHAPVRHERAQFTQKGLPGAHSGKSVNEHQCRNSAGVRTSRPGDDLTIHSESGSRRTYPPPSSRRGSSGRKRSRPARRVRHPCRTRRG